jgi:hypothetical protein
MKNVGPLLLRCRSARGLLAAGRCWADAATHAAALAWAAVAAGPNGLPTAYSFF